MLVTDDLGAAAAFFPGMPASADGWTGHPLAAAAYAAEMAPPPAAALHPSHHLIQHPALAQVHSTSLNLIVIMSSYMCKQRRKSTHLFPLLLLLLVSL